VAKSIAIPQQSNLKADSFSTPYLVARREWDERYGGLIKRAQQWRAVAILALLVALAEAIVIIAVATRPRTAPFVVAVDSLGRVAAAGAADRNSPVDERMKQAAVTQWVQDMRGVTSDGLAERAAIVAGKKIFTGPIKDVAGTERVAANASLDDGGFWKMDWYVPGVITQK